MITNLKSISKGRRDVHDIDPRVIVDIDGLNERVDYGDLGTLKEQIRVRGVKTPLRIKLDQGKVGLVEGYRRMRCVRELISAKLWTHHTVPAIPEERGATIIDRLVDQIVGNEGKPYTILEEGRVFERLLSEGLKKPEIAERTGKSRTHVTNALALAGAPPAIVTLVEQNKISGSLVIELIHEATENEQTDNAKLVAAVNAAISNAAASGKQRASRKHTASGSRKEKSENGSQKPAEDTQGGSGAPPPDGSTGIGEVTADEEELVQQSTDIIREERRATISLFQRRLRLGYVTAKRIMDILVARSIVAPMETQNGSTEFPILISLSDPPPSTVQPPPIAAPAPPPGPTSDNPPPPSDSEATRVRELYNALDRHLCDDKCYDTIRIVAEYLENKRTLDAVKNFVRP